MKRWPVQDAKARFSQMLDDCLKEGPQIVTRRGTEAAVLVPVAEWRNLRRSAQPDLKRLLLTPTARGDIPIPARGKSKRRRPSQVE